MGLSYRLFVLSGDNKIFRLAHTTFWRMLNDPAAARLPDLAGQRVRTADAIVELDQRVARRVLRCTFSVLTFDRAGCLDAARFRRQQFARAENALDPALGGSEGDTTVVEAVSRFVAHCGTWQPSEPLRQDIEAAALGRLK